MASGTINGSTGNSAVYAKIEWSYTQSVTENTSTVTATAYIRRIDDGTWNSHGTTNITLTINGSSKTESKYFYVGHGGTSDWYQMITSTVDVAHNTDGSHSDITISCTSSGSGTTVEPISCSGTVSLPTIARASIPTGPSIAYFDNNITIQTHRNSTSFIHNITFSIGQAHILTTEKNITDSYTWKVPSSWADVCPTSTSTTLTVGVRTFSGNTQIGGTQVLQIPLYVPDSWKPSVSIGKTISNGGNNGQAIASVSTINLSASASAYPGTSISSYSWSGGAVSGAGASKTHSPTATGTYTYTVTATDGRGRTGTATVTQAVVSGISSFTCASSVNFGSALAVSISRIKSSFTHNVAYTINSSYTNTLTGQGTSASYTIPTSWAASVPAASAINMTVTVTTYNGSTSLGSASKTVSVVVPSSWVPSFTLTAEAVSAFNSQYLKGVSKVKLTASSVSPSTGSQIASYSFTGNNVNKTASSTATSYNVTSDLLTVVGANTYTVKVTDKRGRVTTKTTSITVVNYAPPTIKLSVGRYDSGGTADNFGGYGRMYATGSWVAVSGNSWTLTLKQKKKTASSYTTVNTWSAQTASSVSKTSDLFAADVDSAYDCQATITDAVGKSSTVTIALSTGRAIMDWFKDKVVGIFSTASETLRNALGNAATLLYSGAERTYLNGRVFVPKPGTSSVDGLTDGWRDLTKGYIHFGEGSVGTAGYVKICRIVVGGTYMNTPIEIVYDQRNRYVTTTLFIKFVGGNTTDPDLDIFGYVGNWSTAYIVKAAASTWDIYISKAEPYDYIGILDLKMSEYSSARAKITWTDEQATSLPTGYNEAENIQDVKNHSLRTYMAKASTIPDLVNEVRSSSGAMGSVYITTAYSWSNKYIPTGWYNFLYIPHREGGAGRRTDISGDNPNYGNLFLHGMTSATDSAFKIRCYSGAVQTVWDLRRIERESDNRSWIKARDGALVRMTASPNSNSIASVMSIKTVNGAWDIVSGGSSVTGTNGLFFLYTPDEQYNSGTNRGFNYYWLQPNGYFNIKSDTCNTASALSKTTFSLTNANSSYGSIQQQRCVKMGNIVYIYVWYSMSSSASASGQPTVLNIPSGYRPLGNIYTGIGFTGGPLSAAFAVAAPSGAIQVPAAVINGRGSFMINMVYDV